MWFHIYKKKVCFSCVSPAGTSPMSSSPTVWCAMAPVLSGVWWGPEAGVVGSGTAASTGVASWLGSGQLILIVTLSILTALLLVSVLLLLCASCQGWAPSPSKHTYIYRVRMVLLSSLLGHAHISKKASLPAVSAIQSRSALLGNADSAQIPERPFLATVIIGTEQCCWVTLKMPSRVVGHNYLIINYEWKHVLSLSSRTHTHLSIYIKEKRVSLSFNFPFV